MEPTLRAGDRLLFRSLSKGDSPGRGDIVVFADPGRPGKELIKRVIAIAGDKVEITKGQVLLNGERLEEPYLGKVNPAEQLGPVVVPEGHVWVLGDNRARSYDSRQIGPVPLQYVKGVRVQ